MPDISLITSAYRTDQHLASYLGHVTRLQNQLTLKVQVVVVVNDATPRERELLAAHRADWLKVLYVPRESIYASWNRGVEAADAPILGIWNVDDVRNIAGLQEGYRLLNAGYDFVDFAFDLNKRGVMSTRKAQYSPHSVSPKTTLSPFWMFRRDLYQRAGPFEASFKIAGDFEWSKRAEVRGARFTTSDVIAGTFYQHGDNLTGAGRPLEWVEYNIALLWHGGTAFLRPVDPQLMRQTWEAWGHKRGTIDADGTIDAETAQWLWGEGAQARYQAYTQERQAHPFLIRLRLSLARRGLIKSVMWDVHSKAQG